MTQALALDPAACELSADPSWRHGSFTMVVAPPSWSMQHPCSRCWCSAAYNLAAPSKRRGLLRHLDHAAIFLLIAGTYARHP